MLLLTSSRSGVSRRSLYLARYGIKLRAHSPDDLDADKACGRVSWLAVLYGRHGFVRVCNEPVPGMTLISEDSYGFQTNTKLRMVLSVALVDAMIKDGDIVSVSPYSFLIQAVF